MPDRLPLDANLIGYWGFDEAMETDAAVDATANALHLTVVSSLAVGAGRVANARDFDGTNTYAEVSSALLRLTGDLTGIAWAKLDSFNSGGSQLRTLFSCGGTNPAENLLYGLSVDLAGRLVYKHDAAGGIVVVRSAPNAIRTGQFYNLVLQRSDAGSGTQNIAFFRDNVSVPVADVTVNAVPSALPVPVPVANPTATFQVGRSRKEANSGLWDGLLDEFSIHNVARPYQPYLIASYFRSALRSATTKLTSTNNVLAVSSAEMGAGVRWWCVERDRDLYVVKESPFGSFGAETRLTTPGSANSALTGTPELLYDAAADVLYVFFLSGNRIYKLTANSTDVPATINMPFTADTGSIIKSLENVDGSRVGEGGGSREVLGSDFAYVNRQPLKFNITDPDTATNDLGEGAGQYVTVTLGTPNVPQIALVTRPVEGFGVLVGPVDSEGDGIRIYRVDGGAFVQLAAPTLKDLGTVWFLPISPRQYGARYVARALDVQGRLTDVYSAIIVDNFGEGQLTPTGLIWSFGRDGDGSDSGSVGEGGGSREVLGTDFSYVNRSPLKLSMQDPDTNQLGEGGGQSGTVTQAGVTRNL